VATPESGVPWCLGQTATIYVKDGTIVGGPDNGPPYRAGCMGRTVPT
jgi:hypothetical protein